MCRKIGNAVRRRANKTRREDEDKKRKKKKLKNPIPAEERLSKSRTRIIKQLNATYYKFVVMLAKCTKRAVAAQHIAVYLHLFFLFALRT